MENPFEDPYNIDDHITSDDVRHFLAQLPSGGLVRCILWHVALFFGMFTLLPVSCVLCLLTDKDGWLSITWQLICRMASYHRCMYVVMREFNTLSRAQLVYNLSHVKPEVYEKIQRNGQARLRKAMIQLALHMREYDPGFLSPRWHHNQDFKGVRFKTF